MRRLILLAATLAAPALSGPVTDWNAEACAMPAHRTMMIRALAG